MLKNYLISLAWSVGIILIGTIFLTLLNYFNILKGTALEVVELMLPLISIFVGSYLIGKRAKEKGYLEGIKYGGGWLLIMIIMSIILKSFHWSSIIYFLVLMLGSVGAAMTGINRKRD